MPELGKLHELGCKLQSSLRREGSSSWWAPKRQIWDQAKKPYQPGLCYGAPAWWVLAYAQIHSLALGSAQGVLSQEWVCHLLRSLLKMCSSAKCPPLGALTAI